MTYKMHLYAKEFDKFKSGVKTVEMRVYDDKRRLLKIGDEIELININTEEILKKRVINIQVFKDFSELYKNYDKKSIGYNEDEVANPLDMEKYYNKEEQEKFGVVAIELQ